jgi:hypothetical protein
MVKPVICLGYANSHKQLQDIEFQTLGKNTSALFEEKSFANTFIKHIFRDYFS